MLRFCVVAALSPVTVLASAYVHPAGAHRWSIGNDVVERIVAFSNGGVQTEALIYKATGRDFTAYSRAQKHAGSEFRFIAGDQAVSGTHNLNFEKADIAELAGGKQLSLDLVNPAAGLEIRITYAVYDQQPALRKWITVHNTSEKPVYLRNMFFESLGAAPGDPADLTISAGYGAVPQPLFFTGRVSDCCIFVRNSATSEGMAIINEAPGYLKRTEVGRGWTEAFEVGYDTDLFPFGRTLAPGERFESARSSLILFQDNRALADSRWAVPGYMARIVSRRHAKEPPRWLFNTWEPFERRIDQATVARLAPAASAMGIDIFTIDDGWQSEYGVNDVDRAHFPQGMPGIQALLGRNNLKLGLWVPLAAISTKTPEYREHPEWACRDRSGAPKFTGTASGQSAVMCLASAYREAALRRLDKLIAAYHPAYIKVDLTTVFNAYGEQPGCYAQGHQHSDWAESLTRIYEALGYIGDQLYRLHPDVLVDYTFELWGEKHLIDPALLGVADLDWLSNIEDRSTAAGGPLEARMLLYQRAPSIPAEAMLIGNLHAPTPPIEERFAVAISSGPLFLGDLRKLSAADLAWYREKTSWFKNLRSRASLSDSFFPLGAWREPGSNTWDGLARLSRDSDGIVVLFKNRSGAASARIQLTAPSGAKYQARSIITREELGQVSSEELQRGWVVPFASAHSIQIIELRRR